MTSVTYRIVLVALLWAGLDLFSSADIRTCVRCGQSKSKPPCSADEKRRDCGRSAGGRVINGCTKTTYPDGWIVMDCVQGYLHMQNEWSKTGCTKYTSGLTKCVCRNETCNFDTIPMTIIEGSDSTTEALGRAIEITTTPEPTTTTPEPTTTTPEPTTTTPEPTTTTPEPTTTTPEPTTTMPPTTTTIAPTIMTTAPPTTTNPPPATTTSAPTTPAPPAATTTPPAATTTAPAATTTAKSTTTQEPATTTMGSTTEIPTTTAAQDTTTGVPGNITTTTNSTPTSPPMEEDYVPEPKQPEPSEPEDFGFMIPYVRPLSEEIENKEEHNADEQNQHEQNKDEHNADEQNQHEQNKDDHNKDEQNKTEHNKVEKNKKEQKKDKKSKIEQSTDEPLYYDLESDHNMDKSPTTASPIEADYENVAETSGATANPQKVESPLRKIEVAGTVDSHDIDPNANKVFYIKDKHPTIVILHEDGSENARIKLNAPVIGT